MLCRCHFHHVAGKSIWKQTSRSDEPGSIILISGAFIQTAAYHVPQMIIRRFVAGIGNGMNTASIPVWQSETVPARHRGHAMVLQLALNQVGNMTSQWLNYGMTFIASNSVAWRFPLAFQMFFAILTILLVPFLPDSPRWLVLKNRNNEALEVIRRLGGPRRSEEDNREMHAVIQWNVDHAMSMRKLTIKSIFQRDSLHTTRRVLLGAGTQFMQQWSGINAILYYLPVVFASLGLDRNLSIILSCCNAMDLLISTCVGALYFAECRAQEDDALGCRRTISVLYIRGHRTRPRAQTVGMRCSHIRPRFHDGLWVVVDCSAVDVPRRD